MEYKTNGVCSQLIYFEVDQEDRVHDVKFVRGCDGNLKGIGKLVEGMKREEIIERLKGVRCGNRATSCPDQLAKALEEVE